MLNVYLLDPSQPAGSVTQFTLDDALRVVNENLPVLGRVVGEAISGRSAAESRLDAATRVRWGIQAQIHALRLLHRTALAEEITAAKVVMAQGGRVNPFEDPAIDYLPLRDDHWNFSVRDEEALIKQLRELDREHDVSEDLASELECAASEEAEEYSEEEEEQEEEEDEMV